MEMAIPQEEPQERHQNKTQNHQPSKKPLVWDCGSTLYDSFELKSFERQLYSAINSRTMSMPHLADRRTPLASNNPPPPPNPPTATRKLPSKFSRSLHKLLKSVFKPKQEGLQERQFVYDKSGALTTIPEVPAEVEFGGFSPEIKSLVGRTASARFTATSISVSCA